MSEFALSTALRAIRARNAENGITPLAPSRRIDPNSPQFQIARAQQLEADMVEKLHFTRQQPDSELKQRRLNQIMDRIAELSAAQGDYSRAATISHSPERREHYQNIVHAIKRNDAETCDCPDDLVVDRANGKEIQSPAVMTVDRIITQDGVKNLDKCRKCGHLNAR